MKLVERGLSQTGSLSPMEQVVAPLVVDVHREGDIESYIVDIM